jgi:hypothetical protein
MGEICYVTGTLDDSEGHHGLWRKHQCHSTRWSYQQVSQSAGHVVSLHQPVAVQLPPVFEPPRRGHSSLMRGAKSLTSVANSVRKPAWSCGLAGVSDAWDDSVMCNVRGYVSERRTSCATASPSLACCVSAG